MKAFRDQAFFQLLWRSIIATIAAVTLMATLSADLTTAALIGANMALLFSVGLIAWANLLSDDRVVRSMPWRALPSSKRPAGAGGRRCARKCLQELELRFAEAGAAVAIVLSASALVLANA